MVCMAISAVKRHNNIGWSAKRYPSAETAQPHPHLLLPRLPLPLLHQGRPQLLRQGLHRLPQEGRQHRPPRGEPGSQHPGAQGQGRPQPARTHAGRQPRAGNPAPTQSIEGCEDLFPHLMKSKEIDRSEIEVLLKTTASRKM